MMFEVKKTTNAAGVETFRVNKNSPLLCAGNFATKQEADLYSAALNAMQVLPEGSIERDMLNLATHRFAAHRSLILGHNPKKEA